MSGPVPGHVAPARYVLTVLHRQDPEAGPGKDGEGEPCLGKTLCGLWMGLDELWMPVEARPGDSLCAGCEEPDRAEAEDVQGVLL